MLESSYYIVYYWRLLRVMSKLKIIPNVGFWFFWNRSVPFRNEGLQLDRTVLNPFFQSFRSLSVPSRSVPFWVEEWSSRSVPFLAFLVKNGSIPILCFLDWEQFQPLRLLNMDELYKCTITCFSFLNLVCIYFENLTL